jgi:membrane-associated phospholipid phosphatase
MAIGSECKGIGIEDVHMTFPDDFDFVGFWSSAYSTIPYVSTFAFAVTLLITRRFSNFLFIPLGIVGSYINEEHLNNIKREGRPETTCLEVGDSSWPSGHSVNAFSYFIYGTWEAIFHPTWPWKKKFIIIFLLAITFIPVGPARVSVGDHSWEQIGVAYGAGAIWGTLYFWIIGFLIFQKFALEPLFSLHFMRRLLQNDYQPTFNRSWWKGEKYTKKAAKDIPHQYGYLWGLMHVPYWKKLPKPALYAILGFIPAMHWILGIITIVIGSQKIDTGCETTAGKIMEGMGILTMIAAYFETIVLAIVIIRFEKPKFYDSKFYPELIQILFHMTLFVILVGVLFDFGVGHARDYEPNCPPKGADLTDVGVAVWSTLFCVVLIYGMVILYLLRLDDLFSMEGELNENKEEEIQKEKEMNPNKTGTDGLPKGPDISTDSTPVVPPVLQSIPPEVPRISPV